MYSAAAYYMILEQRLGGRETFPEKRELFYTSLERHHAERFHKHVRIPLLVSRGEHQSGHSCVIRIQPLNHFGG